MILRLHVDDDDIIKSIIVNISNIRPHATLACMPEILKEMIRKCAIPVIDEDVVWFYKIIGYVYIEPAVAIDIHRCCTKAEGRIDEACLCCNVYKLTTVIPVEPIGFK